MYRMVTLTAPTRTRLAGLDALRGLAILLMIADHALVVGGQVGSPLRHSVTRLALPAFMLAAGSLVGRLRPRRLLHLTVAGLALPLFVPWIDDPNVLVLYVLGALLLRSASLLDGARQGWTWVLLVTCLTVAANRYDVAGTGFDGAAVVGLMAAGRLIGADQLARAAGPLARTGRGGVLGVIGRHPFAWYVGHLVVLEALRRWSL